MPACYQSPPPARAPPRRLVPRSGSGIRNQNPLVRRASADPASTRAPAASPARDRRPTHQRDHCCGPHDLWRAPSCVLSRKRPPPRRRRTHEGAAPPSLQRPPQRPAQRRSVAAPRRSRRASPLAAGGRPAPPLSLRRCRSRSPRGARRVPREGTVAATHASARDPTDNRRARAAWPRPRRWPRCPARTAARTFLASILILSRAHHNHVLAGLVQVAHLAQQIQKVVLPAFALAPHLDAVG